MSLSPELEAVKDAMDKGTGDGRDHPSAVQLSDAYVASHPELAEELGDWSIEQCVDAVSTLRAAGMLNEQWKVEVWLLHKWPPQNIGGEYHAQVRIPNL
jgi:hypothetical protein